MKLFDRINVMHQLLSSGRRPVPIGRFLDELDCTRSTFKRIKSRMVDYLNAPVIRDVGLDPAALRSRVRLAPTAQRRRPGKVLGAVTDALLNRAHIVGFQHYEGLIVWPEFEPGSSLTLTAEPANEHDRNPVSTHWRQQKLGYIPRLNALAVSALISTGVPVRGKVIETPAHRLDNRCVDVVPYFVKADSRLWPYAPWQMVRFGVEVGVGL